jgi:hypothetical protein
MTAPSVLTAASTLTCTHGGTVTAATSDRLRVGKQPVLLAPLKLKPISQCSVKDDANTSTLQCRKVATVTTGQSSRLTVRGTSVLLATIAGLSDGTPPPTGAPLAPASANQTRLSAAVKP